MSSGFGLSADLVADTLAWKNRFREPATMEDLGGRRRVGIVIRHLDHDSFCPVKFSAAVARQVLPSRIATEGEHRFQFAYCAFINAPAPTKDLPTIHNTIVEPYENADYDSNPLGDASHACGPHQQGGASSSRTTSVTPAPNQPGFLLQILGHPEHWSHHTFGVLLSGLSLFFRRAGFQRANAGDVAEKLDAMLGLAQQREQGEMEDEKMMGDDVSVSLAYALYKEGITRVSIEVEMVSENNFEADTEPGRQYTAELRELVNSGVSGALANKAFLNAVKKEKKKAKASVGAVGGSETFGPFGGAAGEVDMDDDDLYVDNGRERAGEEDKRVLDLTEHIAKLKLEKQEKAECGDPLHAAHAHQGDQAMREHIRQNASGNAGAEQEAHQKSSKKGQMKPPTLSRVQQIRQGRHVDKRLTEEELQQVVLDVFARLVGTLGVPEYVKWGSEQQSLFRGMAGVGDLREDMPFGFWLPHLSRKYLATQVLFAETSEIVKSLDERFGAFVRRNFCKGILVHLGSSEAAADVFGGGDPRAGNLQVLLAKWLSMDVKTYNTYLDAPGGKLFYHAGVEMAKAFHLGGHQQRSAFFLDGGFRPSAARNGLVHVPLVVSYGGGITIAPAGGGGPTGAPSTGVPSRREGKRDVDEVDNMLLSLPSPGAILEFERAGPETAKAIARAADAPGLFRAPLVLSAKASSAVAAGDGSVHTSSKPTSKSQKKSTHKTNNPHQTTTPAGSVGAIHRSMDPILFRNLADELRSAHPDVEVDEVLTSPAQARAFSDGRAEPTDEVHLIVVTVKATHRWWLRSLLGAGHAGLLYTPVGTSSVNVLLSELWNQKDLVAYGDLSHLVELEGLLPPKTKSNCFGEHPELGVAVTPLLKGLLGTTVGVGKVMKVRPLPDFDATSWMLYAQPEDIATIQAEAERVKQLTSANGPQSRVFTVAAEFQPEDLDEAWAPMEEATATAKASGSGANAPTTNLPEPAPHASTPPTFSPTSYEQDQEDLDSAGSSARSVGVRVSNPIPNTQCAWRPGVNVERTNRLKTYFHPKIGQRMARSFMQFPSAGVLLSLKLDLANRYVMLVEELRHLVFEKTLALIDAVVEVSGEPDLFADGGPPRPEDLHAMAAGAMWLGGNVSVSQTSAAQLRREEEYNNRLLVERTGNPATSAGGHDRGSTTAATSSSGAFVDAAATVFADPQGLELTPAGKRYSALLSLVRTSSLSMTAVVEVLMRAGKGLYNHIMGDSELAGGFSTSSAGQEWAAPSGRVSSWGRTSTSADVKSNGVVNAHLANMQVLTNFWHLTSEHYEARVQYAREDSPVGLSTASARPPSTPTVPGPNLAAENEEKLVLKEDRTTNQQALFFVPMLDTLAARLAAPGIFASETKNVRLSEAFALRRLAVHLEQRRNYIRKIAERANDKAPRMQVPAVHDSVLGETHRRGFFGTPNHGSVPSDAEGLVGTQRFARELPALTLLQVSALSFLFGTATDNSNSRREDPSARRRAAARDETSVRGGCSSSSGNPLLVQGSSYFAAGGLISGGIPGSSTGLLSPSSSRRQRESGKTSAEPTTSSCGFVSFEEAGQTDLANLELWYRMDSIARVGRDGEALHFDKSAVAVLLVKELEELSPVTAELIVRFTKEQGRDPILRAFQQKWNEDVVEINDELQRQSEGDARPPAGTAGGTAETMSPNLATPKTKGGCWGAEKCAEQLRHSAFVAEGRAKKSLLTMSKLLIHEQWQDWPLASPKRHQLSWFRTIGRVLGEFLQVKDPALVRELLATASEDTAGGDDALLLATQQALADRIGSFLQTLALVTELLKTRTKFLAADWIKLTKAGFWWYYLELGGGGGAVAAAGAGGNTSASGGDAGNVEWPRSLLTKMTAHGVGPHRYNSGGAEDERDHDVDPMEEEEELLSEVGNDNPGDDPCRTRSCSPDLLRAAEDLGRRRNSAESCGAVHNYQTADMSSAEAAEAPAALAEPVCRTAPSSSDVKRDIIHLSEVDELELKELEADRREEAAVLKLDPNHLGGITLVRVAAAPKIDGLQGDAILLMHKVFPEVVAEVRFLKTGEIAHIDPQRMSILTNPELFFIQTTAAGVYDGMQFVIAPVPEDDYPLKGEQNAQPYIVAHPSSMKILSMPASALADPGLKDLARYLDLHTNDFELHGVKKAVAEAQKEIDKAHAVAYPEGGGEGVDHEQPANMAAAEHLINNAATMLADAVLPLSPGKAFGQKPEQDAKMWRMVADAASRRSAGDDGGGDVETEKEVEEHAPPPVVVSIKLSKLPLSEVHRSATDSVNAEVAACTQALAAPRKSRRKQNKKPLLSASQQVAAALGAAYNPAHAPPKTTAAPAPAAPWSSRYHMLFHQRSKGEASGSPSLSSALQPETMLHVFRDWFFGAQPLDRVQSLFFEGDKEAAHAAAHFLFRGDQEAAEEFLRNVERTQRTGPHCVHRPVIRLESRTECQSHEAAIRILSEVEQEERGHQSNSILANLELEGKAFDAMRRAQAANVDVVVLLGADRVATLLYGKRNTMQLDVVDGNKRTNTSQHSSQQEPFRSASALAQAQAGSAEHERERYEGAASTSKGFVAGGLGGGSNATGSMSVHDHEADIEQVALERSPSSCTGEALPGPPDGGSQDAPNSPSRVDEDFFQQSLIPSAPPLPPTTDASCGSGPNPERGEQILRQEVSNSLKDKYDLDPGTKLYLSLTGRSDAMKNLVRRPIMYSKKKNKPHMGRVGPMFVEMLDLRMLRMTENTKEVKKEWNENFRKQLGLLFADTKYPHVRERMLQELADYQGEGEGGPRGATTATQQQPAADPEGLMAYQVLALAANIAVASLHQTSFADEFQSALTEFSASEALTGDKLRN
eukprot:g13451.t1